MYCSTCELEIKGDDKQACPICGGALTAGFDTGVPAGRNPQEQSAFQDVIEDINSLIGGPAPAASGAEQEAVFVLQDYEDASREVSAPAEEQAPGESQLFAAPCEDEPEQQPTTAGDAFRDTDVSLQDKLDSIQQSLFLSDSPEVVSNGAAFAGQEDKEEFSFPDTFEPDRVFPDDSAEGPADFMNDFDGDESKLISAYPPQNRKNLALLIVLLIVLLAGGGYFATRFITSGSSDEQPSTVRTVMPLSAIKAEEKQQAEAQKPDASSVVPEKPAPAGQVPSAGIAAADAQPPSVSETTAEPLSSAAPAEMMSPAVSRGPAPVAGKDIPAVPAIEKPVEPSQAQIENTDVPSAVPVQDSIGLQSAPVQPPAAVQSKKPVAEVTAPFYTVHVGSYRNRDTAASESARISAKGHDAFVERADLGPRGIWFRVKVGRFKTRAEAESLKAKIHKVLVPDSVVVMNSND
ncbi:MAG: hypothetical protein FJ119_01810 [Deltaproteobacteria bacterium]|nr:hypothetical protein [Deltaproteobacteria bacterium]